LPSDKSNLEVAILLLDKGADVNAKDKDGGTALREASRRSHNEMVNLLKAYGGERNRLEERPRRYHPDITKEITISTKMVLELKLSDVGCPRIDV